MIDFNVEDTYSQDLFDDICDNREKHLYEFLEGDIIKAFHFALIINNIIVLDNEDYINLALYLGLQMYQMKKDNDDEK